MSTRHTRKTGLLPLVALAGLAGCNPWDDLPNQGSYEIETTWRDDLVAATDGLYIPLPYAGELVRVDLEGGHELVDLDGASPTALALTPDESMVMAFAEWPVCESDDPDVVLVSDCPEEELTYESELDLVQDGSVTGVVDLPAHFNELAFSPSASDGEESTDPVAVAYLDYDGSEIDVDGVLNLTEVMFINLATGETQSVSVGFSANNVLFTEDGSRAVVLSRSQAVVVDLTGDSYEILVTYKLTLDADQEVDPVGAAITGDGQYLLISVEGSGDLYALNLEQESINIVDLEASPASMSVDTSADLTTLVYSSKAQVDVLEHDYFDLTTLELDEPCTEIVETSNQQAILYNDTSNTHDIYLLDLTDLDLVEYVVGNPVESVHLGPDEAFAAAVLRPESSSGSSDLDSYYDQMWGLSILDLASDDSVDLVLESEPVGLAFAGGGEEPAYALLLLDGLEDLLQVTLRDASVSTVELPAPPTSIGSMPSGDFYITHDSALGMVSFLDPSSGSLTQASGFAIDELLAEESLPRQDSEADSE